MLKNNLLHKIRTLFAMAKGNNSQAEAEAALAKAYELMQNYNIPQADVDRKEEDITHEEVTLDTKCVSAMYRYIATIVKKFFGVSVILDRRYQPLKYLIIGEKTKAQVGHYVFTYLTRRFKQAWSEYKQSTHKPQKNSFMAGMFEGLYKKLETIYNKKSPCSSTQKTLIVTNSKIAEYTAANFGVTKRENRPIKLKDSRAFSVGKDVGSNINIRNGVSSSNSRKLLTT